MSPLNHHSIKILDQNLWIEVQSITFLVLLFLCNRGHHLPNVLDVLHGVRLLIDKSLTVEWSLCREYVFYLVLF